MISLVVANRKNTQKKSLKIPYECIKSYDKKKRMKNHKVINEKLINLCPKKSNTVICK